MENTAFKNNRNIDKSHNKCIDYFNKKMNFCFFRFSFLVLILLVCLPFFLNVKHVYSMDVNPEASCLGERQIPFTIASREPELFERFKKHFKELFERFEIDPLGSAKYSKKEFDPLESAKYSSVQYENAMNNADQHSADYKKLFESLGYNYYEILIILHTQLMHSCQETLQKIFRKTVQETLEATFQETFQENLLIPLCIDLAKAVDQRIDVALNKDFNIVPDKVQLKNEIISGLSEAMAEVMYGSKLPSGVQGIPFDKGLTQALNGEDKSPKDFARDRDIARIAEDIRKATSKISSIINCSTMPQHFLDWATSDRQYKAAREAFKQAMYPVIAKSISSAIAQDFDEGQKHTKVMHRLTKTCQPNKSRGQRDKGRGQRNKAK